MKYTIVLLFAVLAAGYQAAGREPVLYDRTLSGTSVVFPEVERINRIPTVGLYRGGPLVLKKRVALENNQLDNVDLGIDQEGILQHVIRLKHDRFISFELSGQQKIKDVFLRSDGLLMAIDSENRLLTFSPEMASLNPKIPVFRQFLKMSLIKQASFAWFMAMTSYVTQGPLFSQEMLMAYGLGMIAIQSMEAFRAARLFEIQNEETNFLRSTGVKVENYLGFDEVTALRTGVVDFELRTKTQTLSLNDLIQQSEVELFPRDFTYKCEYELLGQDVPPSEFTSDNP